MSTHWALRLIHFLYVAFVTIASRVLRRKRRPPKPLQAHRSKIPKHLCLNLVANNDMPTEETETAFLQCLQGVAAWCRVLGIETLTVYDRHGVLYGSSEDAHRHVFIAHEISEDSCESELEYPLTPPLSESSGSRSHSPEHATFPADLNMITMVHLSRLRKRRNVAVRKQPKRVYSASSRLTLHIVSRASGKPAIVSATRSLLRSCVSGASMSDGTMASKFPCNLTVSQLAVVLEAGLPSPDLMIIHHIGGMKMPYPPIEFHGFPPWQNNVIEFQCVWPADYSVDDGHFDPSRSESLGTPVLISETAFCRALDEYSGAEFRLGR
ncbi:hypothetical protein OG21DRAFT_1402032 [Imleria badia]|nr:hypothetical protein OG21DRAFT_1402032 [Imleria badia]